MMAKDTAERGVAVVAEVISEGKLAVTGVVSLPNFGLLVGMMGQGAVGSSEP